MARESWIIRKCPSGYFVTEGQDKTIAFINYAGPMQWTVAFEERPEYYKKFCGEHAELTCIGYVRGIEQATQ